MKSPYQERHGLILSMTELSQDNDSFDESPYTTHQQAFYEQTILRFVVDEVHAMMQVLCCEWRLCATFYNPFYTIVFVILYVLTIPGAFLHWYLLSCVPVRLRECPEEREIRTQGIYTATGIALFSLLVILAKLFVERAVVLDGICVVTNLCIVTVNMIALRAIADELLLTTRMFIVCVWLLDCGLVTVAMFDVYAFANLDWGAVAQFSLRLVLVFVYTTIGVQAAPLWDLYADRVAALSAHALATDRHKDFWCAAAVLALTTIVLGGLGAVVSVSSDD